MIAEAEEALRQGLTHYGPSEGLPELREAISEHLAVFGIDAEPSEILVTPGASFALFLALKAVLRPGDEVIVPAPSWFVYPSLIRLAGGKCIFVDFGPDYKPDQEALEGAVGPRTKAIIINTPNNPSGKALSAEEVRLLWDLAIEHDLFIISDEVYKMITYDGVRHFSLASKKGPREKVMLVDAFSKAYAMTGWRLGYLVAPKPLRDEMVAVQRALIMCVPPFIQRAGLAALRGPQEPVRTMVAEYQARRDLALEALSAIPGVRVRRPEGALYLFPDLSAYGLRSSVLVAELEREFNVKLMPGELFGPGYEHYIRISFCRPREELIEGLRRLAEFLRRIRRVRSD